MAYTSVALGPGPDMSWSCKASRMCPVMGSVILNESPLSMRAPLNSPQA